MDLKSQIEEFLAEQDDDEDEDDEEEDDDARKEDERQKGGGHRKRRTAYSSGRREKMGLDRKGFVDLKSDLKKQLGVQQADTKKRTISRTDGASSHRWKKY